MEEIAVLKARGEVPVQPIEAATLRLPRHVCQDAHLRHVHKKDDAGKDGQRLTTGV